MSDNSFSSKNRTANIQQMQSSKFDVLVIGGGITGAGIALDASARGLSVLLVDMQDFAGGTSSRSTKLIHGGLRYLKQMEFRLVAEVGKERAIIHRNAPHLTTPEPMLLPITKDGSFGKFSTRIGMIIYEWLAGVKHSEQHKILNAQQTLAKEPLLQRNNLLGSALFYEYRTDDARLTIEVLKSAVERNAMALNYVWVTGFNYESGQINGANVVDVLSGKPYTINAKYVINASGPWVDEIDSLDNKNNGNKLQITKGVHLVVDHKKLPIKQCLYIDTFDKRMIFLIPRNGKIYIGTTDTFYEEGKVDPEMTNADRDYLLKCVNSYFPDLNLIESDIESGWVGLRPLIKKQGKKPSEISRKDETFIWPSGLITIAGGKLTGYRKMAERVVDKVAEKMNLANKQNVPASSTADIKLSGGKTTAGISFPEFVNIKTKEGATHGLGAAEAKSLVERYGSNVDKIYEIIKILNAEKRPLNDLPLFLYCQVLYVIENEMCVCPADFFIRRTGMLFFDIAVVRSYKAPLLRLMAEELGWSDLLTDRFSKQLDEALK